jgi:isoprenylcysteine carboxyl methyltransferase (ICMT) family protein YpbQ
MLKKTVVRDTWVPYSQPTKGYILLKDGYMLYVYHQLGYFWPIHLYVLPNAYSSMMVQMFYVYHPMIGVVQPIT